MKLITACVMAALLGSASALPASKAMPNKLHIKGSGSTHSDKGTWGKSSGKVVEFGSAFAGENLQGFEARGYTDSVSEDDSRAATSGSTKAKSENHQGFSSGSTWQKAKSGYGYAKGDADFDIQGESGDYLLGQGGIVSESDVYDKEKEGTDKSDVYAFGVAKGYGTGKFDFVAFP